MRGFWGASRTGLHQANQVTSLPWHNQRFDRLTQDFDGFNGHQPGLTTGCRLVAAADPHAATQALLDDPPVALAIDAADAALLAEAAQTRLNQPEVSRVPTSLTLSPAE